MSALLSEDAHRPQHETGEGLSTFASIARLYPYMRPAMPRITLGMVAALAASIVSLAIPLVLQKLVDGTLLRPGGDRTQVVVSALFILLLGVAEAVLISLRRWFVLTPGTRVEADLRNSLYGRLQRLPVAFHDSWPSGQLLSRAVSDLNLIRRWLSFGLVLLVVNVVTIFVGFAALYFYHWLIATVMIVLSLPVAVASFFFERKYHVVARRSQDQQGDLATAVEEAVHGIRVLKAFGRGRHALKSFRAQAEELRGTELEKARAVASLWLWLLMVPDIAFAVCLALGVWLVAQDQLTVGQLLAFFATATVLRFPIESIGFLLSMTFDTRTAVDRFFDVMNTPNPIEDPAEPEHIADPRGELVFDDVHFRYEDAPARFDDLVDGVRLTVHPGETMALVGLTGSGKSTLTSLVPRLYDVTGGAIRIDGVDIRDLTLDELRTRVAMAFEDATLFSSSVRDNVLVGRADLWADDPATRAAADAQLAEALEVARADFA